MRNFQQLASNIDVMPLLVAIQRQPTLWNQNDVRGFHPQSAHKDIDDIILRYNAFDRATDDFVEKVCSEIQVEDYPALTRLPQARPIIFDLMRRVEGSHLGRVFISRMRPGSVIPPHVDLIGPAVEAFPNKIQPADYYDRYHVVLASGPGAVFDCGEETTLMMPGECWWFNNSITHQVINNSASDRIHMIIDIHS